MHVWNLGGGAHAFSASAAWGLQLRRRDAEAAPDDEARDPVQPRHPLQADGRGAEHRADVQLRLLPR